MTSENNIFYDLFPGEKCRGSQINLWENDFEVSKLCKSLESLHRTRGKVTFIRATLTIAVIFDFNVPIYKHHAQEIIKLLSFPVIVTSIGL